jgi:hypothetical protein
MFLKLGKLRTLKEVTVDSQSFLEIYLIPQNKKKKNHILCL